MLDKDKKLNDKESKKVAGGTFTPNKYSEETYKKYGVTVDTDFFAKDKFTLPNGKEVYEDEANEYVESLMTKDEAEKAFLKHGAEMAHDFLDIL